MPVEQDDEVTTFDPKPWGAMQRVLPNGRFSAGTRTSGPLQASSVAMITPLPQRGPLSMLSAFPVTITPVRGAPVAAPLADLPLTAYGAEIDSTMRVRRTPLTARSLIAVPLGAALAAIVILIATAGSNGSTPVAASIRMNAAPVELPVIAPISADVAAAAAVGVTQATIETEAPAAVVATPAVTKRATKRARSSRPRKIVAVDASTPLGNLRPRRF
jgi:hypothetical protein